VLVVNSFASERSIITRGYSILPKEFEADAYKLIFANPAKIGRTYLVTIGVTAVGTAVSLALSSMAAYVLSRKRLKTRNALAFFLYFTQLFNGGLVPYFLLVTRYLKLQNNPLVLLLVPMFSVMYILILRNFIANSIPESVIESAVIDGLGDFGIWRRIVLPLATPALASIGLFTALAYWNDWWTPMMFIRSEVWYPLQYTLYQMLSNAGFGAAMVNNVANIKFPGETMKLAMTVVATGPIIVAYPLAQRYFVSGITLGAVKG
jgi:putative aldouronate transport system permease protein